MEYKYTLRTSSLFSLFKKCITHSRHFTLVNDVAYYV